MSDVESIVSQLLVGIQQDIRELRTMMADISTKMVLKEDFVRLETRVAQLEANRLPQWMIPLAAVLVAAAAIIAEHIWK